VNEWPATKIDLLPIDSLIAYARNARTHSDKQVDKIVASIKEFGWTIPILIGEDHTIIAGHGRVLAAKKLKITEVPTMMAKGWSEAQKRAYVIADNKLTIDSDWNEELLKVELMDLKNSDFDLSLTGFDSKEIDSLLVYPDQASDDDAAAIVDKVEECQQKWNVQLGDLYQCGNHRILCGDSTKAEDVARVLMNDKPNLMVTDPPYGVEYDPTWRDECGGQFGGGKTVMRGSVENDNRVDWLEAWNHFKGDVAYVWNASLKSSAVLTSLESSGFIARNLIVWAKQHFTLMRHDYHWQHELCWYCVRKGKTAHWIGDRKQTTIWSIESLNAAGRKGAKETQEVKVGHGTQKPIECMARPIQNHDSEFVYEPFSGSGTTLIACEQLNRKCLAIELNPSYVSVALERFFVLTGQTPVKL